MVKRNMEHNFKIVTKVKKNKIIYLSEKNGKMYYIIIVDTFSCFRFKKKMKYYYIG